MVRAENEDTKKVKEYFELDAEAKSAKCSICFKCLKSNSTFNLKYYILY